MVNLPNSPRDAQIMEKDVESDVSFRNVARGLLGIMHKI